MAQSAELAEMQLIVSSDSVGIFVEAQRRVTAIATRDIAAEAWLVIERPNAKKQRWN